MNENMVVKRGFKKKTIVSNIRTKMHSWIKTLPEELREEVTDNYIVTGGAIASMLLGDLPNDYDVYFRTPEVAVKVAQHYLNMMVEKVGENTKVGRIEAVIEGPRVRVIVKSAGVLVDDVDNTNYDYFEMLPDSTVQTYFAEWATKKNKKAKYTPAFITSNAISLHDDVQLMMRFTGSPEEIHRNYDFVHCTNVYTHHDGLILRQAALESLMARELKYIGSLYPVCSAFRLRKFIRRGWTITAGEILKISFDIAELDLKDPAVLEDQLIGVDYAYFREILSKISKTDESVDRTYLFELINRVFDEESDDPDTGTGE